MTQIDDNLQPDAGQADDGFSVPALMLAPAVLRIVIAGREIDAELDALVAAVTVLQGSDGFMRSFVFEMAVKLAQRVEASGIAGLAEAAKAGLDADERAMAIQIGLVAMFASPHAEDGDIGVLAAIAERIGLSEDAFSQAFKSAQRALAHL